MIQKAKRFLLGQTPLEKARFTRELADLNLRRTPLSLVLCLFFQLTMAVNQSLTMRDYPHLYARSRGLVQFSLICLSIEVLLAVSYILVRWRAKSSRPKLVVSWLVSTANICYGLSIGLFMHTLGEDSLMMLSSFYMLFLFFHCFVFLFPPLVSAPTQIVICVGANLLFSYMTGGHVDGEATVATQFAELSSFILIMGVCVAVMLYQNHVGQFNRNYTIEQLNQKLSQQVRIDTLTGIYNRKEFMRQFMEEAEKKGPVAVGILDIDFFKQYNDTYGHIKGDECLCTVARSLEDSFQKHGGVVARYGGEEFAVLIPHKTKEEAVAICEEALRAVWELDIPHHSSKAANHVTLSMGLFFSDEEQPASVLLSSADALLYHAKQNGRNRLCHNPSELWPVEG